MTIRTRTLAVGTAAVLALGLSGCSGGDAAPDGDGTVDEDRSVGAMEDFGVGDTFVATEPVTFGLAYRDHPNYPFSKSWSIIEHLAADNGVSFDVQSIPLADWQQKRALLISSGEAADLIPSTYVADVQNLTAGGALLPVSDYLDHMPNFQDKIEKWGLREDLDRTRDANGDFFVLPGLLEQAKPDYTIAIRADLWEQAGLEDPKTWDEFAEQLEVIKEEFPDLQYPYTERWSINGPIEGTMQAAAGSFGTEAGWGFGDGVTWNGSEYEYTGAQDGYRDLVTYFHGLVEDGLLDPEGATQDDDSAKAKFTTGKAAAIGSNSQEITTYRQGLAETGNDDAVVRNIVVPGGPAGDTMDATTGGRFESGIAIAASAADKPYFKALLQYVDWQYYGDSGLEFAQWGVEGETYTVDGGERALLEGIDWNGTNPDAGDDPQLLNTDFGYYNGVWSLAHGSTAELVNSMVDDEVAAFREEMNARKEVAENGPAIVLDDMQREEIAITQTNLEDLVMTATARFITGARSLDEWDAYVGELRAAGMDGFVETINEAAAS
ncbi:extracellular solute-binding protein [Microbacterium karelineae]|uniref:extracellular solute-binding protein n=1 Tax=Microbacterium karelineae TaxID=2654283 RepID=UPI0012EA4A53|nr:extracellular solute-binding protein [Microbacterium karelineae]